MRLFGDLCILLATGLLAVPVAQAQSGAGSDPTANEQICETMARRESGLNSSGPDLSVESSGVRFGLNGSLGIGVSRSGGGPGPQTAPAFAGQASIERRQNEARKKYEQAYDRCMETR